MTISQCWAHRISIIDGHGHGTEGPMEINSNVQTESPAGCAHIRASMVRLLHQFLLAGEIVTLAGSRWTGSVA